MAEDRTGVVARLDALEAAWKAATPGPWRRWGCAVVNPATAAHDVFVECDYAADAAAIVAEHNAMPALLAAVRGVLALADAVSSDAHQHALRLAADVRTAVAAAIEGTGQ